MTTHDIDIELPPEFRSGNSIPVTVATIKRERMKEILREAIEADRKRRGEPVLVGWIVSTTGGGILHASKHTEYEAKRSGYSLPVYRLTSPRTAEPSRGEPVAWRTWDTKFRCWEYYDDVYGLPAGSVKKDMQPLYTSLQPAEHSNGEPGGYVHTAPDDCETLHWRGQILSLNELAMISAESVNASPTTTYCQHPHCQTTGGCQGPCSKKQAELVKVDAKASVLSDSSTHMWKKIEEYSREMYGKKIDIYLGDFLLYCPQLEDEENNGIVIGYYSEPYKGWYTSETLEEVFPTHFMPLPEKPR